jgi:hypothetical protein
MSVPHGCTPFAPSANALAVHPLACTSLSRADEPHHGLGSVAPDITTPVAAWAHARGSPSSAPRVATVELLLHAVQMKHNSKSQGKDGDGAHEGERVERDWQGNSRARTLPKSKERGGQAKPKHSMTPSTAAGLGKCKRRDVGVSGGRAEKEEGGPNNLPNTGVVWCTSVN